MPERTIRADRQRLERALLNILANSAEYAGCGGRVSLRAEVCEEGLRITVEDSGPGFYKRSAAERERRILYRQQRQKRGKAFGLGLFIADRIIGEHGGRLELGNSEALGGGRVCVWLPL